jgi:hypothetical protein
MGNNASEGASPWRGHRQCAPLTVGNGDSALSVPLPTPYDGLFAAFPDFHVDSESLRHGDDHILVEARMSGTQHADWAGIPNTGRRFIVRLAAIFDFNGDELQCERAYFDFGDIARQLTD